MNNEYKEMLERFDQICQNAKKELLCAKEEKEKQKKFLKKIDKELTITEYDEIKYWLANVEILDNTDYILNNRKAKILIRYLKEKDKEIEQLNNIIDGLEKEIKIMEKYFELIIDLGYDYDGFNKEEDLKGLIDELVRYASLGRVCNTIEPIYTRKDNEKFNILGEVIKSE